jgi:hypothetical protein
VQTCINYEPVKRAIGATAFANVKYMPTAAPLPPAPWVGFVSLLDRSTLAMDWAWSQVSVAALFEVAAPRSR